MANLVGDLGGHILGGVAQATFGGQAQQAGAGPAGAGPANPASGRGVVAPGRTTRSMARALAAGQVPNYQPIPDGDHDAQATQGNRARPRFFSLELSNFHKFQYTIASIPYPPTAPFLGNPPVGIEAVPGGVKYYDMAILPGPSAQGLDRFELQAFPTRQTTPGSGAHNYHTEHIFEIHFIKDFLIWAVENSTTTQFDISDLQELFFPNDQVDPLNPINQLLQCLSWWDSSKSEPVDGGVPRFKELMVLEARLNLLKGAILFAGDTGQDRKEFFGMTMDDTFQSNYIRLRDIALVFQYMNLPEVVAVFQKVYARVSRYLQSLDTGRRPNNLPTAFAQWTREFLTARQATVVEFTSQCLSLVRLQLTEAVQRERDPAEKAILNGLWPAISAQFPQQAFQFRRDYFGL